MSLRDEIQPYRDKLGYVNPYPVAPDSGRNCDNALLFTSEYYIMLRKRQEDDFEMGRIDWLTLKGLWLLSDSVTKGVTQRYPGDNTIDAPDNIYGIIAACKVLKYPQLAKEILNHGIRHFGFFNLTGKFSWEAFQWRQPQMLFATACASNSYKWWKVYYYPALLYTASVIATSCIGAAVTDADSRRLCWLLIQAVQEDSWLCRLAAKIWWRRLYKHYGGKENGMREVAKYYYSPDHPFRKYWID